RIVDLGTDVNIAAKSGEELAGSDVPIAIAPGALLPAREGIEGLLVVGIVKTVIGALGGNKPSVAFRAGLKRNDEHAFEPGMADAARIRRFVHSGPPVQFRAAKAGADI